MIKILDTNENNSQKLTKQQKRKIIRKNKKKLVEDSEKKIQDIDIQGYQIKQNYNINNFNKIKINPIQNKNYKKLLKDDHKIPTDLPIIKLLNEISLSVKTNQITIVKAATGSGKSLGIPPHFVDQGMLVRVSLPTIPATLGLYKFVQANANNENEVGYSCYGDVCYNRSSTKLVFCTTKHLINDLKLVLNGTRNLPKNFLLMIDEAHHTSTENKAILKLALYMIKKGFGIKLLIASATLGELNFSCYKSKTIESVGRLYPITVHWNDEDIDPNNMKNAVTQTINKIVSILTEMQTNKFEENNNKNTGILVFVPGESEVETIASQLEAMLAFKLCVFRLYSNIPSEEIMDAFQPIPENFIKVVISTNIGESSITIPDISKVVDMGLQKTPYDNKIGIRLITEFAPKDKLTQRKGRAGRTSIGDYYPMFSEKKWENLKTSDLSDMDRMMPYMIVLEFLDAGLNAQEILEIEDSKYKEMIEKLSKLKVLDCENKITKLGHAVPNYPFSLENAIVAYRAMELIYSDVMDDVETKINTNSQISRNDPAVVAILILISMIEGSQGNSFFWIPKEHRKSAASKQAFMKEKYKYVRGDNDFITLINIFASMIHESRGHTNYSYVRWAQEMSLNNKLLSNARKNFKRLIEITYGLTPNSTGSVEKQVFNMLKDYYNVTDLTQLTHPDIMNIIYPIFENVYIDCTFNDPLLIGKKGELIYKGLDNLKYKIDGLRSFSKLDEKPIHRIVALQVIETKTGNQTARYISCCFPSKDQTIDNDCDSSESSHWETASTDSITFSDIDFTLLENTLKIKN